MASEHPASHVANPLVVPSHAIDVSSAGHEMRASQSQSPPYDRAGLTTNQFEAALAKCGYNELPTIEISLWWVLFRQFTGTMPYMLELACLISIIVADYLDFGIILTMLLCNGLLGFYEELKAAASLRMLTDQMEQKIMVLRDGEPQHLNTRLLVPGDIIFISGGAIVPADIDWIEGDVLEIETAAVTGEPLPRKYPGEYGSLIYAGCVCKSGEAYAVVRQTGANTMVGSASEDIMKDKTEVRIPLFERRVLQVVKIIILLSLFDVLVIFLFQGFARKQFNKNDFNTLLLTCLSIIIAAVPIALPLVLQVTMSLGAGKMASHFHACVTSMPALQDISSMSVLCSDKTGTLTTAKIDISAEDVFCHGEFSKEDVALYAGLASSRDKKEDAIDRSVIKHFDKVFGGTDKAKALAAPYKKVRSVGFNPIYKRVLFEFEHPQKGRVTIAKGLPTKVIDTADGGADDAADQWKVENLESLAELVKVTDYNFSKGGGFKTLGVVVKFNDGPWKFVGILPMLDPPRVDSAQTIVYLKKAGINVKMITGDHLNIAKTTAKKIGMGTNMYTGESTRGGTHNSHDLILGADGFAQVLPKDKREVVLVLRNTYDLVVGMTGDGVNDAPALSAAQCGIAVDDATDAAKKAAAIVLTTPGLSAIYDAVVESRRIFRKLKSYVTYRFGATIQIVIVLTLLILISNCPINSLFVIILALFNDITMLPIAYDNQQASATPENPQVYKLIILSLCLGVMETIFSMIFAYGADESSIFQSDLDVKSCSTSAQAGIWLQIFIAAELLIFSARAPGHMYFAIRPSPYLVASVLAGCIVASIMAASSETFGKLPTEDIALIWLYDIICLAFIDLLKVTILRFFGDSTAVLPDKEQPSLAYDATRTRNSSVANGGDIEQNYNVQALVDAMDSRTSSIHSRMSEWAKSGAIRRNSSSSNPSASAKMATSSHKSHVHRISLSNRLTFSGRVHLSNHEAAHLTTLPSLTDMRQSITGSYSLRPNVPGNKSLY